MKILLSLSLAILALHTASAHAGECDKKYLRQDFYDSAAEDAIEKHDLPCLKEFLAEGAKFRDDYGVGLNWERVVRAGDLDIANYIYSLGFPIREMQPDGQFVSNVADETAVGGSLDMVKFLDSKGFKFEVAINEWKEPYRKPQNHFTPNCSPMLHKAVEMLRADIVRYLLGKGVDANARCGERALLFDNDGFPTPLLELGASFYAWESVNGSDANPANRALANDVLKALIDAGGDLRARDDNNGEAAYQRLLKTKWISPEMVSYVKARLGR